MNKDTRNKKIYDAYISGEKCPVIAKQFGLTKQRVTQIAVSLGAAKRAYEPAMGEKGWMVCKVDKCKTIVRSRWGTLCNKHYFRGRRTGTTEDRKKRPPCLTSHGYLISHQKGHPAASKTGMLYEHRKVFYEKHGNEKHRCFWCKDWLSWGGRGKGKIHVDHLNGDKTDNNIKNLVASCHRCNVNRGLFMSWLSRHKDDPIIRKLFDNK